jgi:tetratricopeptide (TPR) repeat protein
LVQDAAYSTLLRDQRKKLHKCIAEFMLTKDQDTGTAAPELLARHYTEAGLIEQGVHYWQEAGRLALARGAQQEAAAHLQQAANLIGRLPESPVRDQKELTILLSLGQALFGAKGGAAPETSATFDRANELARRTDHPDAVRRALYGIFISNTIAGNLGRALDGGNQLLVFADRNNDDESRIAAGRILGSVYALLGNLTAAEEHLGTAIELFQRRPDLARAGDAFAHNPGKTAPATLSHVRWSRGFPDQALRLVKGALQAIDPRSEANTASYIMLWSCLLNLFIGIPRAALEIASELEQFTEERGSRFWMTFAQQIKGAALIELGQHEMGLGQLSSPFIRAAEDMGERQHDPFFLSIEARAFTELGKIGEGEDRLDKAHRCLEETNQLFYAPGVYLASAELLMLHGKRQEAQAWAQRAIQSAQIQGSKSWELRASIQLAKLLIQEGKLPEAQQILQPIFGWFTEGFDTPDLVQAQRLLEL